MYHGKNTLQNTRACSIESNRDVGSKCVSATFLRLSPLAVTADDSHRRDVVHADSHRVVQFPCDAVLSGWREPDPASVVPGTFRGFEVNGATMTGFVVWTGTEAVV